MLRRADSERPICGAPRLWGMAKPEAKPVAKKEGDDRLAMLKELAKLTKPTGKSAQGKSEEGEE